MKITIAKEDIDRIEESCNQYERALFSRGTSTVEPDKPAWFIAYKNEPNTDIKTELFSINPYSCILDKSIIEKKLKNEDKLAVIIGDFNGFEIRCYSDEMKLPQDFYLRTLDNDRETEGSLEVFFT